MSHVDGFHAGGANGLHAEVGIFVGAAMVRVDADAAGGFEENVRGGLLMFYIFAGDDGIEVVTDAEVFEDLLNDVLHSARGHGHRQFAMVRLGYFHDDFDGFDVGEEWEVSLFLFPGDGEMVQLLPLFFAEHLDDVARGDSAQGVEAFFREVQAMTAGDRAPGSPVKRHSVGQRSIAIENNPTYVAHSWAQFSSTVRKSNCSIRRIRDDAWNVSLLMTNVILGTPGCTDCTRS